MCVIALLVMYCVLSHWILTWGEGEKQGETRRFELPSLPILHVRCQFCVIHAVGRKLQFLPVWVSLREKSIVQRDGQAQGRAQAKLEWNQRWFERKIRPFSFGRRTHPLGGKRTLRWTHPMESSILRLTCAVQTTSVVSIPQDVSGLAVG